MSIWWRQRYQAMTLEQLLEEERYLITSSYPPVTREKRITFIRQLIDSCKPQSLSS